jgi:hypothetical protein
MASSTTPSFEKRSRQIVRMHRKVIRRGGELNLGPDGLLTVRPKRGGTGIPFRGLFIIAALLFGAKAMMLVQDGAVGYGERVEKLAQGGMVEQAGAFVMQADPLTVKLAAYIQPLLK